MRRVDGPEILDSDACSGSEAQAALAVIGRVNRWFGGVSTTQKMIERAAQVSRATRFSILEVGAGPGELPEIVRQRLSRRGITLDVTLLDRAQSHLPHRNGSGSPTPQSHHIVADALALPFGAGSFDLVSCCLFAHHLDTAQLAQFVQEAVRVSRRAVLINDLVRHPLHLSLAYAGYPLMLNRVAWLDGLTSVRRAYVPEEIRRVIVSALPAMESAQVEISRHYLFRMGAMVWKRPGDRSPI
jgi:ubiquinone/menaquinone biosynthesis C-methylase UbiE